MGYKLIKTPYVTFGGQSDGETVKFYTPQDASLSDMLEMYQRFLRASGYVFDGNIEIVPEDEVPTNEDKEV